MEAGITHPNGCMCEGCVRARREGVDLDERTPAEAERLAGCPAANGGGCFCTGACRGERSRPRAYGVDFGSTPSVGVKWYYTNGHGFWDVLRRRSSEFGRDLYEALPPSERQPSYWHDRAASGGA